MYVDIVISNVFNLNKHFLFFVFLSFLLKVTNKIVTVYRFLQDTRATEPNKKYIG